MDTEKDISAAKAKALPDSAVTSAEAKKTKPLNIFWRIIILLVHIQAWISGLAILSMIAVTCTSVIRAKFSGPINGADDIVRMASAVAIACALPYTTAVKGHVAIEFFFHKLGRLGRIITDSALRIVAMSLFGLLSWRCFVYGLHLKKVGQVTMTLELEMFWVPQVISVACGFVVLIILFNMLHPGREMIKP